MAVSRVHGAVLLIAIALTGCAAQPEIATLEPEASTALPSEVPQRGTPELWGALYQETTADGRDRILLLNQGDEALEARVNLIRSAQKSIKIATFIWEESEVLSLLLWEIARAVEQRGVRVQILTDSVSSISDPTARARVMRWSDLYEVRVYNPLSENLLVNPGAFIKAGLKDFWNVNQRMHTKLFVVDDKFVIAGGRNYGNEYFDRNLNYSYLDRDVLVVGPSVQQVSGKFAEFWDAEQVVDSRDMPDVQAEMSKIKEHPKVTRQSLNIYGLFDELEARADDPQRVRSAFIDRLRPVERIQWVIDSPGKPKDGDDHSETTNVLRRLFENARREVLIQSPYLVVDDKSRKYLRAWRQKHPQVDVRISTNSFAAADHEPAYALVYRQSRIHLEELSFDVYLLKPIPNDIDAMMAYGPLLHRKPTPREAETISPPRFTYAAEESDPFEATMHDGSKRTFTSRVNPHTLRPPNIAIHAKSMVFDDIAWVGSYNFDPRSSRLNCEVAVVVHDAAFAAELKREIELAMRPGNSWRLAPYRYPLGIGKVNEPPHAFFDSFVVDPWPIRYGGAYELKEGCEPCALDHPEFFDRYQSVGDFPDVDFGAAWVRVWLYKTIGPMIIPLL